MDRSVVPWFRGTSWHRRAAVDASVDGRSRLESAPLGGDRCPDRLDVDDAIVDEAAQDPGSILLFALELAGRPAEADPDLGQHAPGEMLQLIRAFVAGREDRRREPLDVAVLVAADRSRIVGSDHPPDQPVGGALGAE